MLEGGMTGEEKDKVIYEIMKLHAGNGLKDCPLGHLTPKDTWKWVDDMNKILKDMPYFYLLTGDKGIVVLKKPPDEEVKKWVKI